MGRHDFFSKYAPRPGRLRFAISRVAVLVLVIVVLAWIAISILLAPPPVAQELETVPLVSDPSASAPADRQSPSPAAPEVTVHVVGAVKKPGVYQLPVDSRIADAVDAAGGLAKGARAQMVNLAAKLVDGQQVVLPGAETATEPAAAPSAAAGGKISLNSADSQTLQELPGIGPALAARIIDFRTENGPFSSVEELDAVPGIGPALLGQLSELVIP
ncbi:helix-hairpin-helix domain-containing protein [Glutamicibacter sp. NPDC127525]|uniref:helix-hairpin-helix domain-containing protein n=1 Tax=unclassified Glutamicibacter TaxID=2627139 RepID=UPI003634D564